MSPRSLGTLTMPLLGLVAFNLLPHFYLRPIWATALCAIFLGYRIFVHTAVLSLPPKWVIFVAQIVVGVAIWQHYGTIFGDEASGTLLSLLTCLKTYELRAKRDYFVNSLLCFLVLMSNLLLDQSLLLTLYVVADAVLIVSFLYALEGESFSWKSARGYLRPTFGLALKSAPLLVVTFILFPRFSTGFGTGDQQPGKTGITDSLRPGMVSKLIQSEELVFRATFLNGEIPAKRLLYWRGAILDQSDGLNWDREKISDRRRPPPAPSDGDIEIFLEAGFEKFLFALENTGTVSIPADFNRTRVFARPGNTFELSTILANRERYLIHNLAGELPRAEDGGHRRYLQVSAPPTPRMIELLKTLRTETAAGTVSNVLGLFRGNGYQYSMEPPPAENIDDFIFNNKIGFCEHYAGSMATMLRYMGIPSRVVVGFQGGTPSFLENYISVRGQDAHAWLEYFDAADARWRRVDPTAQVAPARLQLGSQSYLQDTQSWVPKWLMDSNNAYRRLRTMVDEVEASWIGFLLRFDLARQKELLAKFGMEETLFRALPVFLLLTMALILAVLYFLEAQKREVLSVEERLYREVLKILKRWKLVKAPTEGPLQFIEKIRRERAPVAVSLEPIWEKLVRARFAGQAFTGEELSSLKAEIRAFGRLKF